MDNDQTQGEAHNVESEAREMGWVPQSDFKGDQSKWVDAETFVERGNTFIPFLRNNNKKLHSELDSVKSVVSNLKQTIEEQNASMEALKAFHQESTRAQVEKARRDLLSELKAAKQDGDIEQEVKLTADLSRFDAAQEQIKQNIQNPIKQEVKQQSNQLHPDTEAWMRENTWYGQDFERTALMNGVCQKMRAQGSSLSGMEFLKAAGAQVAARFGDSEQVSSKVDSGSRANVTSGKVSSTYASLPSEAKEQCDKQAARFVGENKVYKTKKEWQDFYATEYWKGN